MLGVVGTHSFTHFLSYLLTRSLTHLLTHSLTYFHCLLGGFASFILPVSSICKKLSSSGAILSLALAKAPPGEWYSVFNTCFTGIVNSVFTKR